MAILGGSHHPADPSGHLSTPSKSMPRLGIDTFARVHKLATRSMQQRCIPRTFASVFSRGCNRHTDVGKRVANVGVHSILRIIFSLPFLFRSLLSLSLSLSLFLFFSQFSFVCFHLPSIHRPTGSEKNTFSSSLFSPFLFVPHNEEARYRGHHGPERLFHTSARARIRK